MQHVQYYILEEGKPIATDASTHGNWIIETPIAERRIGITKLGNYEVSTVFAGTYAQLDEKHRPLIFETMISKNGSEERKTLYATYSDLILRGPSDDGGFSFGEG